MSHRPVADDPVTCLVDAVTAFTAAGSLPEVAAIVKTTARRLVAADGATFVVSEAPLCYYLDEDAISPLWKGRRFDASTCISGWAMQYRQQVIIADIYADDRIPHDAYRPTFVQSLVMTPVRALKPLAAIGTYWKNPHTCSAEEAGWLQALADSTALALDRLRVKDELEKLQGPSHAPATDLVVCAWTRRVHDQGEWISLEAFLKRRFGIRVSHSISEDAIVALEQSVPPPPAHGRPPAKPGQ